MAKPGLPVHLMVFDIGYRGGIVRTVLNLAGQLAGHHDVTVISVIRQRDEPGYPIPAGVRVRYLDDRREPPTGVRKALADKPTRLFHSRDDIYQRGSAWTDLVLARALVTLPGGVLITTRPSLHLTAAQFTPDRVLVIGQEHINFKTRAKALRRAYVDVAARLDALAVLTQADQHDFRRLLRGSPTEIAAIPNALPWRWETPAPLTNKVVIAAGRLHRQKGFDQLIEAYEPVARARPDWQLHIYGSGGEESALRRQIQDRGLSDTVVLKGRTERMAEAMADSSIYALSSRFEGFPMVLLEAMSVGLAVVSFDCPRGPAEVISPGQNGLLVTNGDIAAFGNALLSLIEDEESRRRMGANAFQSAQAYEPEAIVQRWEDLFTQLGQRHRAISRRGLVWRRTGRRFSSRGRARRPSSTRQPRAGTAPDPGRSTLDDR